MKKEKYFKQIKVFLILFFISISFMFLKDKIKIALFLGFSFFLILFTSFYINQNKLDGFKEILKILLSFINISSLVYLLEDFFNTRYFDFLIKKIYPNLFEKGINTKLFMITIFAMTSVLLILFNRLNLGEKDGQ